MTTASQALEALADLAQCAGAQVRPRMERNAATLRAALESTAAELEALRGVSDEYNAWVYFHAAGGTFDEFIVKRCTQSDAALTQGGK